MLLDPLREDLQSLPSLTDAALLESLRTRHAACSVYTFSGPKVVVSVNPFDWAVSLPLYSEEVRAKFQLAPEGDLSGGRRSLPPHLYAVGEQARRRRAEGLPQALVVGGESGAGKTEAVKILLQYLCQASGKSSAMAAGGGTLVDRLIELNPLLESFGNATTALNHNSSRFGKLITLQYERAASAEGAAAAHIVGARISSYLLETVRVVHHAEGEAAFHIFYQLLAGVDQSEAQRLRLRTPHVAAGEPEAVAEHHSYLMSSTSGGSNVTPATPSWGSGGGHTAYHTAAAWCKTMAAADAIGICEMDRKQVREVLAAILHLGDLRFVESDGLARFSTSCEAAAVAAADCLGVPLSQLQTALCTRSLAVHGQVLDCGRSGVQARASCDALAKRLYSMLFTWLVRKIDVRIEGDVTSHGVPNADASIVMLDLFGFECLATNSFEQLCINYANEVLQAQFNADVFSAAAAEALAEGIDLGAAAFADNSMCVAMLDGRGPPPGLLPLLNEECALGDGTDANFLLKLAQAHRSNPHLRLPGGMSAAGVQAPGGRGRASTGIRLSPTSSAVASRLTKARSHLSNPGAMFSPPRRHKMPSEILRRTDPGRLAFAVVHFAGEVVYDASGIRDKNVDVQEPQHTELFTASSHPLMQRLLEAAVAEADTCRSSSGREASSEDLSSTSWSSMDDGSAPFNPQPSRDAAAWRRTAKQTDGGRRAHAALMGSAGERRKASHTIAGQFVKQLSALRTTLFTSECQYVRCIKPNARAAARAWDAPFVARQLAQGGVFEAARAARRGYDHRLDFGFFYARYRCLEVDCPSVRGAAAADAAKARIRQQARHGGSPSEHGERLLEHRYVAKLCAAFFERSSVPEPYQLGHTKVFMRGDALAALDERRRQLRASAAVIVQAGARRRAAAVCASRLRDLAAARRQRSACVMQAAGRGLLARRFASSARTSLCMAAAVASQPSLLSPRVPMTAETTQDSPDSIEAQRSWLSRQMEEADADDGLLPAEEEPPSSAAKRLARFREDPFGFKAGVVSIGEVTNDAAAYASAVAVAAADRVKILQAEAQQLHEYAQRMHAAVRVEEATKASANARRAAAKARQAEALRRWVTASGGKSQSPSMLSSLAAGLTRSPSITSSESPLSQASSSDSGECVQARVPLKALNGPRASPLNGSTVMVPEQLVKKKGGRHRSASTPASTSTSPSHAHLEEVRSGSPTHLAKGRWVPD